MILGAVLYVYKGEWGLPSIDLECLKALCAVKFTRAPIEIKTSGNPFWSGAGTLPYLIIGKQKLVGYAKIKQFLDSEGFTLNNSKLNKEDKILSSAYCNHLFGKLHSYYFYHLFGISNNFEITRNLYANRTPFPFSFYYPNTFYDETEKIIDVLQNFQIYDKVIDHDTDNMILEARRCVNLLSKKLGNKVWFFGDVYSELDAIMYSYISILYNISLPNNPIQLHIKECKNLVIFINRITKDIFRDIGFNSKPNSISKKSSSTTLLTASEQEFNATKKKTQILAGVGALVCMSAYAAYNGLLKISFDRNYEENFDIDAEESERNIDD